MSPLKATVILVGVACILVSMMAGCSSSESVVLQNVSERGAWSADNFLAFTAFGGNGQRYIWRCTASGDGQVVLTRPSEQVNANNEGGWHPVFSPDATRIAFSGRRGGGTTSIYLMDARDGDLRSLVRVTDSSAPGQDIQPNYRRDGGAIVFATDKVIGGQGTGSLDIATIAPDGTGLQYVVATPEVEQWPCFSPDGTRIAYQAGPPDGPTDIHIVDIASGADTNLTAPLRGGPGDRTRYEAPAWGTVGGEEWIYLHSNRNGDFDIFRIRPSGADLQAITGDSRSDGYPVISPNGNRILLTRDRELWTRDAAPGPGNETRVTHLY